MKSKKSLVERLNYIESCLGLDVKGRVPGTILQRTLLPESGIGWSLSVGRMMESKRFFVAPTIDEVVNEAEKWAKTVKVQKR